MFKKIMLASLFAVSAASPIKANFGEQLVRVGLVAGVVSWAGGVVKACVDGEPSKKSSIPASVGFTALTGGAVAVNYLSNGFSPTENINAFLLTSAVASFISFVPSAGIAATQFVKSIGMEDDKAQAARKRSKFSGTVAGASVLALCASIYRLSR